MNTNTITTVLDLAYDESTHATAIDALAAFLLEAPYASATVLEEHGPGGGWPVVRFTLPADKLGAFAEAYGMELEELLELL